MAKSRANEIGSPYSAGASLPLDLPPSETSLIEPDPAQLLYGTEDPPPFPSDNIFPIDWRTDTPKLRELYDSARDPGWSPERLPWDSLDVAELTIDQRYAIAYWFALLSVFDGSGPAVFARAMIRTYETHEEDPIRKCFFSITRDEMNHEEVCGRAIQALTPGGPLGYEPETTLGVLARHNIRWYYHHGARYWTGYKTGITKHPIPILFTAFLFGEIAASTWFKAMHERTTIPLFKEIFQRIAQDENRHRAICTILLRKVLPKMTDEEKQLIARQLRAGFVFLSGILYEPPHTQFWELPAIFIPAHRMLEDVARTAGFGILPLEERRQNWRDAVLKLKGLTDPFGIEFPALPEIGIDGATVPYDPDEDIIAVF